jgi:hypothetical protein
MNRIREVILKGNESDILAPETDDSTILSLLDDTESYGLGGIMDTKSNVSFDLLLNFKLSHDVPVGEFYLNGFAHEGGVLSYSYSELQVIVATNPKDGVSILSRINPFIRETIRHEIEHFTQRGGNSKQGKELRHNCAIRNRINSNRNSSWRYLLLKDEVDANIHGLYTHAKSVKLPFEVVVNGYLDAYIKEGELNLSQKRIVYRKWKNRIPTIGGIPELR